MPQMETSGPFRRTNGEGIGHGQIAARRPSKASRNRRLHAASLNIITKSSAGWAVPCLKQGLAGPSVGQTVKESAMPKSPRAALQRQAAIAAVARAHQVLVNAPPQAPIIERAPACEQIGSALLWPSVAVPTETSAMGASVQKAGTLEVGLPDRPQATCRGCALNPSSPP
jgi:hypothetical protein